MKNPLNVCTFFVFLFSSLVLINFSKAQFIDEWWRPLTTVSVNATHGTAIDSYESVYIIRDNQNLVNSTFASLEKFDKNGMSVWTKFIPDSFASIPFATQAFIPSSVKVDKNNNIYVLVHDAAPNLTWLMRFDLDGNLIWQRSMPGDFSILLFNEQEEIIAVHHAYPFKCYKFNPVGILLWNYDTNLSHGNGVTISNNTVYFETIVGHDTCIVSKLDSNGMYSEIFTIISNPYSSFLGYNNGDFYTISSQIPQVTHYQIRDENGLVKLSIPVHYESFYPEFFRDDYNNNWFKLIYETEVEIFKFDSLYNQLFHITFQMPNTFNAWAAGESFMINNQLNIPYVVNLNTGETKACVLRVDEWGNFFTDGLIEFPYNCLTGISIGRNSLRKNMTGDYTIYSAIALGCFPGHNATIVKFKSNAFVFDGNIFEDVNLDGSYTANIDYGIAFQPVAVLPDSDYYYSSTLGKYSVSIDSSSERTFEYVIAPNSTLISDSSVYHINPLSSDSCCYDFGIDGNFTGSLICDQTIMQGYCNGNFNIWITLQNRSPVPVAGSVVFTKDSVCGFISTSQPSNVQGDQITWPVDTLYPNHLFSGLITLTMPDTSFIGDTLRFELSFEDTLSNIVCSTEYQEIFDCEYDPFDVNIDPCGIGPNHSTLYNARLSYAIRFQNTGTDVASRVLIYDTLDENLDVSTFEVISSSHAVEVKIENGRILVCKFDNILLPDSSSDFLGSQGYFKYSIKPKPSLILPILVYSKADIYVGFEPPIETEIAFNTLVDALPGINENFNSSELINYFPNPVGSELFIDLPSFKGRSCMIKVYSIQGRSLLEEKTNLPAILNCDNLSQGLYVCEIIANDRSCYFRFIKN